MKALSVFLTTIIISCFSIHGFGQEKKLSEIYFTNPNGLLANNKPAELGVLLSTKKPDTYLSFGLTHQRYLTDANLYYDAELESFRQDERLKHQLNPYEAMPYQFLSVRNSEVGLSIGFEKKSSIFNLPIFTRNTLTNSIGFLRKGNTNGMVLYTDSIMGQSTLRGNFNYIQSVVEGSTANSMFYTARINSQVGLEFTLGKHLCLSPILDLSLKFHDLSKRSVNRTSPYNVLDLNFNGLLRVSYSI
jgi:hypothetical protein